MHLQMNIHIQTHGLTLGASAWLEEREQESAESLGASDNHSSSHQSQQRTERLRKPGTLEKCLSPPPQLNHLVPCFDKQFQQK